MQIPSGLASPPEHCPACSAQRLQTLHACSWLVRSGGGTRPADSMSVLLLLCDGGTRASRQPVSCWAPTAVTPVQTRVFTQRTSMTNVFINKQAILVAVPPQL